MSVNRAREKRTKHDGAVKGKKNLGDLFREGYEKFEHGKK